MTLPKGRKQLGHTEKKYREAYAHVKWYVLQHRGRIIKPKEMIAELADNANYIQGVHFTKSPEGIGGWLKGIYANIDKYNLEELFKWYDPTYTHNSNYWKSEEAPYHFTMEDKTYLFNWFRNMEGFVFMPLNSEPRVFVIEAIWVARLVNMNPNWSNRPIDLFLWAKGLSVLENLHGYESEEVKTALNYLTKAPFNSLGDQNNYLALIEYKRISGVAPIWSDINLETRYSKNYLLDWFVDYPLIFGANLGAWEWLYPLEKTIMELSRICLGWFASKQFKEAIEDPGNKDVFNLEQVDNVVNIVNDIKSDLDIWKGMNKDSFPMSDTSRQEMLKQSSNPTLLDFDVSLFDRYFRLLIIFHAIHVNGGVFKEGLKVPMVDTITPKVIDVFNEPKKIPFKFPLPYKF